ncbi:MAG: hypothetical protein LH606_04040 [Cytophagaceae bacterium]|nr:hypothetical protein [Cytophagaceae bacterium]
MPTEQENSVLKPVQMRLRQQTLDRIENLSRLTGTDNRTQIVSGSIQIAELLLKNQSEGGKLYMEKPDGTRELIKIIGL